MKLDGIKSKRSIELECELKLQVLYGHRPSSTEPLVALLKKREKRIEFHADSHRLIVLCDDDVEREGTVGKRMLGGG